MSGLHGIMGHIHAERATGRIISEEMRLRKEMKKAHAASHQFIYMAFMSRHEGVLDAAEHR